LNPTFGFVVHPLTRFQRRLLGVRTLDAELAFRGQPSQRGPRVVARLRLDDPLGHRATGVLVSIQALPEELLSDQAAGVERVREAVALCHAEGAAVVGLGAVAAVIGGQGKAVAKEAPCPVTTGNGMTAWAAFQTLMLLRRVGFPRGPVGLLGPPGPVANGILRQLVRAGEVVRVVADRPPKPLVSEVEALTAEGPGSVTFVPDAHTALAEGVLLAASSTGGRLKLSGLPPGAVAIDVAEPLDIIRDCQRDDVLVLEGEYVRLPRPLAGGFWHKVYGTVTGQSRHLFACFAEPMLFALAGTAEHCSVGRDVPLERLDAIADLAARHGFFVDRLHASGRVITVERLHRLTRRLPTDRGPDPRPPR
jgi:predicted amino acid dehydrogenase